MPFGGNDNNTAGCTDSHNVSKDEEIIEVEEEFWGRISKWFMGSNL